MWFSKQNNKKWNENFFKKRYFQLQISSSELKWSGVCFGRLQFLMLFLKHVLRYISRENYVQNSNNTKRP